MDNIEAPKVQPHILMESRNDILSANREMVKLEDHH